MIIKLTNITKGGFLIHVDTFTVLVKEFYLVLLALNMLYTVLCLSDFQSFNILCNQCKVKVYFSTLLT